MFVEVSMKPTKNNGTIHQQHAPHDKTIGLLEQKDELNHQNWRMKQQE
jgi:hypothetical protein